jgi:hypothetical protein
MQLKSLLKTNVLIIIAMLAMSFSAFSQTPNLLNYQGVARNTVGNPLPNQTMKLRLSIHDLLPSGVVVYTEIRQITTNMGGLFSVQIGSAGASSSTGTIAGVNWIVGNKFLQVELDPASNNNYLDIGTVQLVSVPYALAAGTTSTVKTNANLTGVVTSVGNQTSIANGAITSDMIASINKSKVGLDSVNNTSDASKPISTLTQSALNLKENLVNKTLDVSIDSLSDVKYPSAKAVKTYVDSKITLDVLLDSLSDVKYPSTKAVKTYVDSKIATTVPPATPSYTEAYDEITSASAGQTVFTLTNTPATVSKLKMFVNGIRISNSAYSISTTVVTYDPSANGNYTLVAGDRVQFDYSY